MKQRWLTVFGMLRKSFYAKGSNLLTESEPVGVETRVRFPSKASKELPSSIPYGNLEPT